MEAAERVTKFRDAALVLCEDAVETARRLKQFVRNGHHVKAEALAADLQRAARDVKWLVRRQPKV
jgi:hypothetical protein